MGVDTRGRRRGAALLLSLASVGGLGIGAGPAEAAEVAVQVPAAIFTVDAAALAAEREDAKALDRARDALSRAGSRPLYAPAASEELALREAALEAIERNIAVRRARITRTAADRTLDEARAVFDPVFAALFNATLIDRFRRVETPDREFKPATERVPVGQTDSKGVFRCNPETIIQAGGSVALTQGPDAGVACHVITFEPRSPVIATQFTRERPAGFYPGSRIDASDPSPFEPRHQDSLTFGISLFQQLPWGHALSLAVSTRREETYYPLNQFNGLPETFGNYARPYFSTITLGATIPLPYTRDFGPTATADTNLRIAREGIEAAELELRATVNATLLDVDTVYWVMVGALQRLIATEQTLAVAIRQRAVVRRLFNEELVTASDRDQAESQVARIQTALQARFREYVNASEAMRELLDRTDPSLIVPVGYRAVLARALETVDDEDRILDNDSYRRQAVAVRIAQIRQEQRRDQTRPDLTGSFNASFAQSGVYGYRSAADSLLNLLSPDALSLSFALTYLYPIGNRAVHAAHRGAVHETSRQTLLLRQLELEVRETFRSAHATLESARRRIAITERALGLAEKTYQRSRRLQDEGLVAVYESLTLLTDLLDARVDLIQARIDARIAESQMLASVSALAERYGRRTAQTNADAARVDLLSATGALTHLGGPL